MCGLFVVTLLTLGLTSCGSPGAEEERPHELSPPLSWTNFEVPPPVPESPELVRRGKKLYAENCAACHGVSGQADGVCAAFLSPKPRDLTSGIYRFKTTPGGDMPTDADLFRTISLGLHGTPMPPWKFLLSEEDRWALVHHVKTFSEWFEEDGPGDPVDLGPLPEGDAAAAQARGQAIFQKAGCAKCHGDRGYGDGPSAAEMKDSFGNAISPRNFHQVGQFKRGHTLRDVALTISTGNNGTPMPGYGQALKPEEIWDLAAYILSLSEKKLRGGGRQAADRMGDELGEPDVTIRLFERSWKFEPKMIRVRQGQVVRIVYQPTDNGLGVGHGFAIDGYDKRTFINGAMVQRPKTVTFLADTPGSFTFYCATQCSTGPLHPGMKGTFVVDAVTD